MSQAGPAIADLWPAAPTLLQLSDDQVHVWRTRLDLPAAAVLSLRRTLTADELARAKRLRRDEDRQRFIAARGMLRSILARYLHVKPGQVRFRYNDYGKPLLAAQTALEHTVALRLQFNLAHAHDLALIAVALDRRLGVDIESMTGEVSQDLLALALTPGEREQLGTLPAHLQVAAFYNYWTRKEAYLKARGEGLSLPLPQIETSLLPGAQARLLYVAGQPQELARWILRELAPGPGYAAALAVEKLSEVSNEDSLRIRCFASDTVINYKRSIT